MVLVVAAVVQVALSYTLGDAYTMEYWTEKAKQVEEMGADSLCIKDMAGLLVPYEATRLVETLKKAVKIPIDLHTHYTSGVASMTYLKAIEAGCDIIDCAMSPFALGTSQPRVQNSVFECILDHAQLVKLKAILKDIIDEDVDSLRFYDLGIKYKTKVEHLGISRGIKADEPLIF